MNEKIRRKRIHSFIGKIISKKQDEYYANKEEIYKLEITENDLINKIVVFQRKVNKEIWDSIVNNKCINQRYLFECEKVINSYHLKNWKVISQ